MPGYNSKNSKKYRVVSVIKIKALFGLKNVPFLGIFLHKKYIGDLNICISKSSRRPNSLKRMGVLYSESFKK